MFVGQLTSYNLPKDQVVKMIFFQPLFMSPCHNFQDFGGSERGKKPVQLTKGQPVVSRDKKENADLHVWEEDDVDSVKVTTESHLLYYYVKQINKQTTITCNTY